MVYKRFNSSMVRLKVNSSISIGVSASRFQFQYGAIKGLISEKIQMPFRSFNSSMVRLKAEQQEEAANMLLGFNSSMVRLKADQDNHNHLFLLCFNSSMVRLKGMRKLDVLERPIVSIPVWCD